MALTNRELKEAVELLKQQAEEQAKISSSLEGYIEGLKKVKAINETVARNRKIEAEILAKMSTLTGQDLIDEQQKLDLLRQQTAELEKQGKKLADNLKAVNKGNLLLAKGLGVVAKGLANIPDLVEKGYGKIKGLGLFELDKATKNAALSMGVLSNQAKGFTTGLRDASHYTNSIGIGLVELSKMQSDYANELGRNVILSEKSLHAMAEMAVVTGLGAEGTTKMSADMEAFGYSAESTRDFLEQTMNDSHKMGINSSKVVKNIAGNMKMLNRYNFKGGVKGLANMAESVTKMGVNMESVTNMADKLLDIEGAVEMSAQLEVLGGQWSNLADPFRLAFQAINDPAQLSIDTFEAAAKSFSIVNGEIALGSVEIRKMKVAAKAMNMDFDTLVEGGRKLRKQLEVKKQIGFEVPDDLKEFISTTAEFSKGKATIEINGQPKLVSQLSKMDITALETQMNQKQTMEETAKQARTFDDTLKNTIEMLKVKLLPLIDVMNEKLIPKLDNFVKWLTSSGWIDRISAIAKQIGEIVSTVGGFIIDHPLLVTGAVLLGKGIMAAIDAVGWVANGLLLAQGFNMGTGGGAGGGLGQIGGKLLNQTKGAGVAANFKGAAGSTLTKLGGVATGLYTAYSEYQENKDKGMSTGENATRSGMKGAGAGLGAWGGAAAGAAIGSVVPVVGTIIGGLIGGALGAWGGGALGEAGGDMIYGDKVNDGLSVSPKLLDMINEKGGTKRSIIGQGTINPIDDADSFLTTKTTGPVARAFSGGGGDDNVKHDFGELKISGDITITSPGAGSVNLDILKNPEFISSISRKITNHINTVKNGVQKPA